MINGLLVIITTQRIHVHVADFADANTCGMPRIDLHYKLVMILAAVTAGSSNIFFIYFVHKIFYLFIHFY